MVVKEKISKKENQKPEHNTVKASTTKTLKKKKSPAPYADKAKMKSILKDLGKLPDMTDEELDKLLYAMALGLIPDRFGLEISADTKIKAIQVLKSRTKAPDPSSALDDPLASEKDAKANYFETVLGELNSRKVDGVDDSITGDSSVSSSDGGNEG